jgi:nucleotide-binding universal stress UspA family protein
MFAPADTEPPRVLVAIKPMQRGLPLPAIRAREFARVSGEILLLSVVFDPVVARGLQGAAALEPVFKNRLIEDQRLHLEDTAQSLRDWSANVKVRVVWDSAAYRGILRVAHEWRPTLLVVGAERQAMLRPSLKGTPAELMHACAYPMLLVKESTSNDQRTILAAVDPSRAESRAVAGSVLRAARHFGSALDCRVRVVHAFPDPEKFALASAVEVSPGVFYATENLAALHRRAVEELSSSYGIDPSHTDVRQGEPAEVIRDLMMEHDVRLVVLGLSRHSRLQQVVLGSITEAVAFESPCDVVLIPQPPQGIETGERDAAAS